MIGTMTGLFCKFCNDRCSDRWNHCIHCGYPLKLSTECLSVRAPECLREFAKLWHTGPLSALYQVIDGRILHRNLLLLTQELRAILNDSRAVARGPSTQEEIENHLHALEYLHEQQ